MLDPEYLERFSDQLLALFDSLAMAVIGDIAKRIVKNSGISDTSKHQISVVQNAGLVYQDVIKRIGQVSGYTNREMQRMFQEAGVKNIKNESVFYRRAGKETIELKQSNGMRRIIAGNLRKTCQELDNLTLTTAVKAQSAYINACNNAMMKVQTGAFSYDKAIADAIKEAAVQGTEVLYPSGHIDKLDVAVRRAVLTGVNQTAAELNLQYAREAGCDYVETTAHSGARPEHAVWQGKVFCLSGTDPKYENFYEATGYGTGPGLCGWNCRHNFYAFFPGISTPAYTKEMLDDFNVKDIEYNGIRYTEYETAQMQRGHERKIRETKRKLAGYEAGIKATDDKVLKETLKKDFEEESVKLKKQEKALKDFCSQTGRRYESARAQVHAVLDVKGNIVGFNRSVAQKAVWANKNHFTVAKTIKQSNTKAADSWAKTHLGVLKTNYTRQDLTIVNSVNRSLQRIYKEYPILNGFIDEIRFTDNMNAVASASIGRTREDGFRTVLKLNSSALKDLDSINRLVEQQYRDGYWTRKDGIHGIIKHEMGHMIEYAKTLQLYGADKKLFSDTAFQAIKSMEFSKRVEKEVLKQYKNSHRSDIIKEKLSIYGSQNSSEFLAEAVSEYKPRNFAKLIVKILKEMLEV